VLILFFNYEFILRVLCGLKKSLNLGVSYGEDGEPVSIEFLNASVRRLIRSGEVSVTLEAKTEKFFRERV
jgi:hypothetical protein